MWTRWRETMEKRKDNRGILTGAVLKNIACLTMFTDHFFAILVYNYMTLHPVNGAWNPQIEKVYRIGRDIGRVSFVLFAYLIVEGFVHTGSRVRYLLRLFLFALLSEIPFDLAFSGEVADWSGQNVYWTLFLGVLMLTLWEELGRYGGLWVQAAQLAVLVLSCGTAFLFSADYRFMGILLIFALYQTRGRSLPLQISAAGLVMFFGTWGANCIRYAGTYTAVYLLRFSLRELYGLSAFALTALYNGDRGRQLPKPFYYGFYPVHLLILYGVARLIGVM